MRPNQNRESNLPHHGSFEQYYLGLQEREEVEGKKRKEGEVPVSLELRVERRPLSNPTFIVSKQKRKK